MSKRIPAAPAPITVEEVQAELDALRGKSRSRELTPEIIAVIMHARTPDRRGRIVPLTVLSDFINRKFDVYIPPTSLRDIYTRESRNVRSR